MKVLPTVDYKYVYILVLSLCFTSTYGSNRAKPDIDSIDKICNLLLNDAFTYNGYTEEYLRQFNSIKDHVDKEKSPEVYLDVKFIETICYGFYEDFEQACNRLHNCIEEYQALGLEDRAINATILLCRWYHQDVNNPRRSDVLQSLEQYHRDLPRSLQKASAALEIALTYYVDNKAEPYYAEAVGYFLEERIIKSAAYSSQFWAICLQENQNYKAAEDVIVDALELISASESPEEYYHYSKGLKAALAGVYHYQSKHNLSLEINLELLNDEIFERDSLQEYIENAQKLTLEGKNDIEERIRQLNIRIHINQGNIAASYYLIEDYENCIKYYERALRTGKLAEGRPANNSHMNSSMGEAYIHLDSLDKAWNHYTVAAEFAKKSLDERMEGLAYTGLALVKFKQDDIGSARSHLTRAINLLEKNKSDLFYSKALKLHAEIDLEEGDAQNATAMLEQVKEALDSSNISLRLDVNKLLGQSYEQLGKYGKASTAFSNALLLQQELHDRYNPLEITRLQYNNKILRDSIMLSELSHLALSNKSKAENESLQKRVAVLMVLLLSGLLALVYYLLRNSRKYSNVVEKKNEEIKRRNLELSEVNKQILIQKRTIEAELKSKLLYISNVHASMESMVQEVESSSESQQEKLRVKKLARVAEYDGIWQDVESQFLELNGDFKLALLDRCSSLNARHIKLCVLLRLGLSYKEIASLMNVTPNSVKTGVSRLKKKLNFSDAEGTLYAYLNSIGENGSN